MNGSSPKRNRGVVFSSSTDATPDRISQLPRPVLHHILFFLGTKDVVRTGILSKTWYQTSTSFPISDFNQSLVGQDPLGLGIHIFVEFVSKSLQNQSRIYGTIPKFTLSMIKPSPHVEDCIQIAIQKSVKYLKIKLMQRNAARLIMPQSLLYAKELIRLSLQDCHLSLPLPPTHGVPTWPSLRKLRLQNCHIDGIFWMNLTFSCPLLESLHLFSRDELGDISLSGLTKLTEVYIVRNSTNDTRDIMVELLDVPCLETFDLYSHRGRCNVDLTACKNLRILNLQQMREPMLSSQDLTKLIAGLPALKSLALCWRSDRIRFSSQLLENLDLTADQIVETDLRDLIAGLPALKSLSLQCKCERIRFSSQLLENLDLTADQIAETDLSDLIAGLPALKYLSLDCKCERIKFSSQQLEDLDLSVSDELVEVSIDAPNLKTFNCSNNVLSSDFFMGSPSLQEVTITMVSRSALSFLELRKFLGGFQQIKLLKFCLPRQNRLLPEVWTDIPVPLLPDIKHLRILDGVVGCRTQSREDCVSFLNGLLRSCRPESISFHFISHGQFMARVFLEELVKGQKHCCMDDDLIIQRGGFHGLRNFKIKKAACGSFISCDEFLELLPTLTSKVMIHFMLEW